MIITIITVSDFVMATNDDIRAARAIRSAVVPVGGFERTGYAAVILAVID